MKRVIVTGANGFIGSNVIKRLIQEGIEVICVDLPDNFSNIESINCSLCKFVGCDLNNPQSLKEKITELFSHKDIASSAENSCTGHSLNDYKIDTIYNFAWRGLSEPYRSDPEIQLSNAKFSIQLLRIASELGCRRFIGIGSIMENETNSAVQKSEHKPGSGYVYGAAKFVTYSMSKCLADALGIDFIWAKITNTYGVGEKSERLINSSLLKIINGQDVDFSMAEQNYDFLYIDDLIEALYLIGLKGKPFTEYMISSGKAQPLKNYLLRFQDVVPNCTKLIFGSIPYTGVNLPLEVFSNKTLVQDTGFKPRISFDEGIFRTYRYLKGKKEDSERI